MFSSRQGDKTEESSHHDGLLVVRLWHAFLELDALPLGFIGSLAVLIGSLQDNSPFTSKVPGSWFFGVPTRPLTGNGFLELVSTWLIYCGMMLTIYVWVRLVLSIYRGERPTMGRLWGIFFLWVIPLMVAGPLLSRDVYSYAAQGEMVSLGISPYQNGPSLLGQNPFIYAVDPIWSHAPAPYGPLFLAVASLFVNISGHSVVGTVVLLRLTALLGVVAVGVYAPKVGELLGQPREGVFVLSALNPLSLYDLASAGHNDAWMLGLMMAGLYYALTHRTVLGIILISLAGAVKAPAFAALAFVGYNWVQTPSFWPRLRWSIVALAVAGVVLAGLGIVTGLGLGWVKALATPGAVTLPADPITALATTVHRVTAALGVPLSINLYLSVMRVLGLGLSGVVGLILVLRSNRQKLIRSLGISLLVLVFFGPVVWPWYLVWAIAVLACSAGKYLTYAIVGISIAAFPLSFPGGGQSIVSWIAYISALTLVGIAVAYRFEWLSHQHRLQVEEVLVRFQWMITDEFGVQRSLANPGHLESTVSQQSTR